ncbi:uncharacterized protein LOC129773702 [Toxorhynchites rutilus septentrionalis]|uniref:uncharacterized protein LOC129773702 n=1 Tax=Toxorhynchites rutilus septentrionalis TaxID=329112 RepID=UPI0024797731|nr:uncharacterized protein LOC129773702 [Toxorhynchites rutilus septentrionalis]
MDDGLQVDAVYTDIEAAFDTVNHEILLAKLFRLGVSERMCNWLHSYLRNRQLCVKTGSCESALFSPRSGVPQGSNLGPLLFTLYFNYVVTPLRNDDQLMYCSIVVALVRFINDSEPTFDGANQSSITGRQLFVKIGSAISAPFIPRCGVPQGSNLGPLLFVLFFNDVSHVLDNCHLIFYADDLKIYLTVENIDDCRQLQQQLKAFLIGVY